MRPGTKTLKSLIPFAIVYVVLFSWQAGVSPLVPIAVWAFPAWILFKLCREVDKRHGD